jgi:acetylornithine deacetylase
MLRELIALPSVSSVNPAYDMGNVAVVERLAEWLADLGFDCELMPIEGEPGKANLIATLGDERPDNAGLVLAGHTDTVPYDTGRWSHDPFRLHEADGRLYGLGTCDMKAFLGIAVEAAREFAGARLNRPLTLLATADEESSMHGAQRLVELGRPRARYALIGEPTGLAPVRMHKGIAMEALTLTGRSGHSSDPSLGNNALDGMHLAIGVIKAWREALAHKHRHDGFAVPHPTLNLGRIEGGDNPNRICAHCELQFDLRLLPGMDVRRLRHQLEQHLRIALKETGLGMSLRNLDVEVPAFETPADADLVRMMEELTGMPATSVAFASEAPFLQDLGMETVVLGPGDIAQAHQPDEYLALDRIEPTLELLRETIKRICVDAHA